MGNRLLPLLVVWLCFTSCIYSAITFSVSYSNVTASSPQGTMVITPTNVLTSVTLSFTASPTTALTFSSNTVTYFGVSTWEVTYTGNTAGAVTLSFTVNDAADYTAPSSFTIYYFIAVSYSPTSFYPGKTVTGTVSLSTSPANSLTVGLVGPSVLTISPSTFTFLDGQSPYSLSYTITSTEPGTYYVYANVGGPDAGFVSLPTPNITVTVAERNVYTTPNNQLTTFVGQSTQTITVYLDVPPDNSLIVSINPSAGVLPNPTSLTFTPSVLALTYTLSANTPAASTITYSFTGLDASKYAVATGLPTVTVSNRTVTVASIPPLLVGVSSQPISVFVANPPPTAWPLTVTLISPDNSLEFSPSALTFSTNAAVSSFIVTAINSSDSNARQIAYSLSGTYAYWYTVPTTSAAAITATIRTVTPTYSFNPSDFPYGAAVSMGLKLDYITPGPFTVTVTATYAVITPSTITFTNSTGSLSQTFSVISYTLGSDRLIFTVSGTDASLVADISSVAITVSQYNAPYITVPSPATVGTVETCTLTLPSPVIDSLIITLTSSPTSIPVTITPNTFDLTSPGFDAGEVTYQFSFLATAVGSVVLNVALSGQDAGLFPNPTSVVVTVTSASFDANWALSGTNVVNVPITGLIVTLEQPHPNGVTLTPSAAGLEFIPPVFEFNASVSQVCVTVIPTTAQLTVTVVFTSSDPTNYIAPAPITFGPIAQKSFNLGSLAAINQLVVGVGSPVYAIQVPYPPTTSVTLQPAANGLTFTPSSLTFTSEVNAQYVSVTATSLANPNPVIIWSVSGASASEFVTPNPITAIAVVSRTLTVSNTNPTASVNQASLPFVVSTEYSVPQGLTITPSAPGVTFNPASQSLQGGTLFAPFTATYPTWLASTTTTSISVQFVLSGTNAGWYSPVTPITFSPSKLSVNVDQTTFSISTYGPGHVTVVTLEAAPAQGITVELCAPSYLVFDPPQLQFAAGQVVGYVQITAVPLEESQVPPPSIVVSLQVVGTNAANYAQPAAITVDISSNGGLQINNFPAEVYLGAPPTPFQISVGCLEFEPFDVTFASEGGSFTFTPATVTFSPYALSYFVGVQATGIFQSTTNYGSDVVTFEISGNDGVLGTPAARTVYIIKRAISASTRTLVANVGVPISGYVELSFPPLAGSITLTASVPPAVTILPSFLTFNSNTSIAYFVVSSSSSGTQAFTWEVTGQEAAYYDSAPSFSFTFSTRTLTLASNSLAVAPGTLNVVSFTLSTPVTTDLTVTPILPAPLVASPPSVALSQGSSIGWFTVSTNGSLYTFDSNTILFEATGSDAVAGYYDLSGVSVSVQISLGSVSVTSISSVEVGDAANPIYFALSIATINGLSITPWANGIVFEPAVLQFPPGASSARLIVTPVTTGNIPISFSYSGPDAWLYSLPATTSISSSPRSIHFSLTSPVVGAAFAQQFYVLSPPPSDVSIVPTSPQLDFTPPVLQFLPTLSSVQAVYTPLVCGPTTVDWVIGGTDAGWYDFYDDLPPYSFNVPCAEISITTALSVLPGIPSNAVATISAPADVTVTPSAPSCTFTPSQFIFGSDTLSVAFSFVCNVPAPYQTTNPAPIPIIYDVTGDDIALVNPVVQSGSITVYSNILTVAGSQTVYSGQSLPLQISLEMPPAEGVTVTPQASNIIFEPASITFSPTSSTTGVFNATALSPQQVSITYALSGPGSNYVGLSQPSTPLTVNYGTLTYGFSSTSNLAVGLESSPYVVYITPPVTSDVSFTPSAPGCTFYPSTIEFSLYNDTALVWLECDSVGQPYIQFTVTGTDAQHYAIPEPKSISIQYRSINTIFSSASFTVLGNNYGYLQLSTPTDNGLTLTPWSASVTFEPATITIPPGGSYAAFTYTGTLLGNGVVSWAVAGADASWYSVPSVTAVTVNPISVTAYVPIDGTVHVGSVSNTYSVAVGSAPQQGLTIRPYGAGLTYTPTELTFGPGQTGVSFQVQASVSGELPVYYEISGPDAQYYEVLAPTYIVTSLLNLRLDISSYSTPYVGVTSPPLLVHSDFRPSASVTLEFVGAGTFSPATVTLGPTMTAASFTFTPSVIGEVAIAIAITAGEAIGDYYETLITSNTINVAPRLIRVPTTLPDLFANVPSSLVSVSVDDLPPNGLTITPSGANTVFTPSSVTLNSVTSHAEFYILSSLPTQFNDFPTSTNAPTLLSWTLSGPDVQWYAPIPSSQINVLRRDVFVYTTSTQLYNNISFPITVAITYPPNSTDLTLVPIGNFMFSPSSITLSPNETSASFTATPLASGSAQFKILFTGSEASLYQPTAWQSFTISQWSFITPDYATLLYAQWSAPQIVRPSNVPSSNVTLTISSDYLDFVPNVLTFGPGIAAAQFVIYFRDGIDYLRSSSFTVNYWVGGSAAYLFSTPASITVSNPFSYPARSLTLFNAPSSLVVGIPSSQIQVIIPNNPLSSLTITPIPYSPHVSFEPPSVTLTRTSTSLVTGFTVTVNHPYVVGTVEFVLTGLDAPYYVPPSFVIGSVSTRQVSFSTQALTVGTASQPFIASLPYPPPNGFSIQLSSQSISFSPSVLNFLPGVATVAFSATGGTVGSSIPVTVSSYGPDVDWHDPASWTFPANLEVSARQWAVLPGNSYVDAGTPFTISYAVSNPPVNTLMITPWAPSITFTPANFTLTPNTTSITFTGISNVGGTAVTMNTILGGTDALLYAPVTSYQIEIYQLYLAADNLGYYENPVDVTTYGEVRVVLDPPVNGLWVTVTAYGLAFDNNTIWVPAGHSYAHFTYTATVPGLSQVYFSVSGPDALLYNVEQPPSPIQVYPLQLQANAPQTVTVGATSETVVLYSVGSYFGEQLSAPLSANVTFLVAPPGAATVTPSVVTFTPTASATQIQITPHIPSDMIAITPVLSGPGASFYYLAPGDSPNVITFTSAQRSFSMTALNNYLQNTLQSQFVVGIETGPFGITANSVPSDVVLYLSAPGLMFIPSALVFTGTYETLYFRIIPQKAILTQITFSVGGSSANWFAVPQTTNQIRVTHNFIVPTLPTIIIGGQADQQTIEVISPLTTTVVVTPTVPYCPDGVTQYVYFTPPYLIFTPNSTSQTFSYVGNCATNNLGSNYNPVVTGSAFRSYNAYPTIISVSWEILEAGELYPYALSFPTLSGVLGVNVVPATFNVSFSPLQIGSVGSVTIYVTQTPRSDVVLTLICNNINFDPPHVTFWPGIDTQTITATPVHADFKDSQNIPFTVDYVISGSNYADYVPPAQTFLAVARGNGALVGSSAAGTVRVALWGMLFVFGMLLLQ